MSREDAQNVSANGQWRSVEEVKPGILERVLAFSDGLICIGVLYPDGWYEDSTVEQELSKINPTHWMPLPDDPWQQTSSSTWMPKCSWTIPGRK